MSKERSTRVRGEPHAGNLKIARHKYRTYDDTAATEWLRLKTVNSRKPLTPELNAVEHARWYHLCDIWQKKGGFPSSFCKMQFYKFNLYSV
jgi:hypothetical protein